MKIKKLNIIVKIKKHFENVKVKHSNKSFKIDVFENNLLNFKKNVAGQLIVHIWHQQAMLFRAV